MDGENEHVAFDIELCRANPEAAADKIAELEAALHAAGQLDRMRVIGFTKLQEALQLSEIQRKSVHADWKRLDSVCTRQMGRISELVQMLCRAEWWITTKPDGQNMSAAIRRVVDGKPDDGTCIRCGAAPRGRFGLCATCLDEDAKRAGEVQAELCGDCPPLNYPTDITRCASCPRRADAVPLPPIFTRAEGGA